MKMIKIKIGKAWSVIKSDGFIRGGKRIFSGFLKMFRRVGSGDILFITSGVGDSALYRCHHVAEELALHGFKCAVALQDNPFLLRYSERFKVFIFHRALFTDRIRKFIEIVKKQKKEIIFETDDLLFDPQYFAQSDYAKKINVLEKKLYENGLGSQILGDPYVRICTTTTTYLADKLREYGKKVFIVPNKLSDGDLETIEKIPPSCPPPLLRRDERGVRIGYFSGTISHNKDFATITSALASIMEKYPQVELVLVGPLDVENRLVSTFRDRIVQLPFVPRDKHFENISRVDINLAPLEMGNPFCEAKSELKFFEAGILEVPTVASATQTFKEAIKDGVDGFVAASTEEWVGKLSRLIEDEKLRAGMGKKARVKALAKYTNKNSDNEDYYNYLSEKIGQRV